jgi:hypothetical protein
VSVGPIRRLVGMLGLLALVPTAAMLAVGRVTPPDAALRALATLVATMLIGRAATWWVGQMARGYERSAPDGAGAVRESTEGRRRDERAATAG